MSGTITTEDMMNGTLEYGTCSDNATAGSILLGVILCVIAVVAIGGNVLTIAAFVKDRSLRQKQTNLLLFSLSCGDLLIALSMPIRSTESICRAWMYGEGTCQFHVFFLDIGVVVGFLSMSAIALDRYLLISREYAQYLDMQSKRNIVRTIALVWAIALTIAFLEIIVWKAVDWEAANGEAYEFHHECFSPPRNSPIFAPTVLVTIFLIPIVMIVGMSLRFLVLLRRRLYKYKSTSDAESSTRPLGGATSTSGQNATKKTTLAGTTNPSSSGAKDPDQEGQCVSGLNDDQSQAEGQSDQDTTNAVSYVRRGSQEAVSVQQESDKFTRPNNAADRARSRYTRPAIIMITLVTCFLICTLPYMVYISLVIRLCPACNNETVRFYLNSLLLLNSAINPFLYAATHPKIRECYRSFLMSLLTCLRCAKE